MQGHKANPGAVTPDYESWLALGSIKGVGPVRLKRWVAVMGSPVALLRASEAELLGLPGMDAGTARAIRCHKDRGYARAQMVLMAKCNARLVTFLDREYPPNLATIYDPPPFLYVRGELRDEDRFAIAVVGSRKATRYGLRVAECLSGELAQRGITVVSGLAQGIDSAGHRGALARGGRTITVLGCGVDRAYPAQNRALMEQIATAGAVMSEYPIAARPDAVNFPRRNRIISGLAQGVVVVEASETSGALLTAKYALDQGREVFAVPGNIDSAESTGTNRLIKQGAKLVQGVEDILDELESELGPLVTGTEKKTEPRPSLPPEEGMVYDLLSTEPKHIDSLAREAGLSSSTALAVLLSLELKGVAKQLPGKMFLKE